jgi:hypothetical protein
VRPEHRASAHKAHVIALTSGILFLAIVAGLKLVVFVEPYGSVTGAASFLLTLPWSLFALRIASRWWALVATLSFGAVNATFLYLIVQGSLRIVSPRTTVAVLVPVVLFASASVWLLNRIEHEGRVRIVNGWHRNENGVGVQDGGIWLATDQDGLRAIAGANGIGSDVPPELRKHFVFVPNETRGISKATGDLLQDGRLVPSHLWGYGEMVRDHIKNVERIRITEGPNKDIEGWADTQNFTRILVMP